VCRIRKRAGKIPCLSIKIPGAPVGGRSREGELTASHITNLLRGRLAPKGLKKSLQVQLPPFGILRPSHKRGATPRIVRFPQKPQPGKLRTIRRVLLLGIAANHPMQIRGMIERASLGKDRPIGQIVIPLHQMMQPGEIVPAMILQTEGSRPAGLSRFPFVIDGETHPAGQVPGPGQILPVSANHHLHHRISCRP